MNLIQAFISSVTNQPVTCDISKGRTHTSLVFIIGDYAADLYIIRTHDDQRTTIGSDGSAGDTMHHKISHLKQDILHHLKLQGVA